MNSTFLTNIEHGFGYTDALRDLGVLSDDEHSKIFRSLWDVRATINVALDNYTVKRKE